jgi:hypothetical protein
MQQFAESIAKEGIRPSNRGVYGAGVYVTPDLGIAMFYAANTAQRSRSSTKVNHEGPTDSICHVFLPAEILEDMKIRVVRMKSRTLYAMGLQMYEDQSAVTVVLSFANRRSVDQVKFPNYYAEKMITLCESVVPYRSKIRKFLVKYELAAHREEFRTAKSYMRRFEEESILEDVRPVNFLELARRQRMKN